MPPDNAGKMADKPVNRLASEISPYLLQHKDNPVAWQAWGPDAFDQARRDNKPILLSIGYAACHWCHVMAHESFENPEISALMNALFVNIKVDREERPDLDAIYQSALALLGEHGGWPLTMFLTPDGEPFWGGTYFPPEPHHGMPGFPQVLRGIATVYGDEPERVAHNISALNSALSGLSRHQSGPGFSPDSIERTAKPLLRAIDPAEGGFGQAPKFPQVANLKILWHAWKRGGNESYRKAVILSLSKMSQGGIYDHLGGGYARYAVDYRWLVPHFEKMLYDNAQIVEILTWVWQDTGNPLFEQRLRETLAWLFREMIAAGNDKSGKPCSAFAASLDADSDGKEGTFYIWSEAEIDAALGNSAALFKAAYDVSAAGNWEGSNILNRPTSPNEVRLTFDDPAREATLAKLRDKLLQARATRNRPAWDDKVLADWNGLMIAALARAATVFAEADWLAAAVRAFDFIVENMQEDGRLRHAWRHGQLRHPATLDDYANLCDAALALAEATGAEASRRHVYIDQAEVWVAILDRHYWDDQNGGYFLTADDTEQLIVRSKDASDNAVPSGNGTIAGVLARLYHLTGTAAYRQRAEALSAAFSGGPKSNFLTMPTLISNSALLQEALQIVVIGDADSDETIALLAEIHRVCLPTRVLQVLAPGQALPQGHPAQGKNQADGRATVYLCRGTTCSLPITDSAELASALKQ